MMDRHRQDEGAGQREKDERKKEGERERERQGLRAGNMEEKQKICKIVSTIN